MEKRRKEMEEKQKREQDKKQQDKDRIKQQNSLQGRVKSSPAIADNTAKINAERQDKLKEGKKDFAKKDQEYLQMKKEM